METIVQLAVFVGIIIWAHKARMRFERKKAKIIAEEMGKLK